MGLRYPMDTKVARLMSIFPGKDAHLKELAEGGEHDMNVSVFLKQIGYPHPLLPSLGVGIVRDPER